VGRPPAEVLRTLAPLVQAGLVRREGGGYHLDVEAWRAVAQDLPQAAPPSPRVAFGMTAEEADLLGRFFVGDRLVELPAQRGKRLVVLERLALEFEPGRRYPEAEVNTLLGRFHPDHATLRRLLVDEGFLDRAGGSTGVPAGGWCDAGLDHLRPRDGPQKSPPASPCSRRAWAGCRSFASVLFSIWRMRSRVTP
jgi:hypothetical protein